MRKPLHQIKPGDLISFRTSSSRSDDFGYEFALVIGINRIYPLMDRHNLTYYISGRIETMDSSGMNSIEVVNDG